MPVDRLEIPRFPSVKIGLGPGHKFKTTKTKHHFSDKRTQSAYKKNGYQ